MRIPTLLLAASVLTLSACGKETKPPAATAEAARETSLGLAIGETPELAMLAKALTATGLAAMFDGKGTYTVLAPTDGAFAALGDKGKALMEPEQKAALAAVLRDHVLPGALTAEDIGKAIDAGGGKPVKMRTLGNGSVAFSRDGTKLRVTAADGASAELTGSTLSGTNGGALTIDKVLKKV